MRTGLALRTILLPTLLMGSLVSTAAPTTPDDAIAQYFNARFAAMDGAGPTSIALVASSNPRLQKYTQVDLSALRTLLASFHEPLGRTHQYRVEGRTGLRFNVYEQTHVKWNDGPNGVRTSGVGYAHTVDLALSSVGGYSVAKDAYRGIAWDSPDVQGAPPIASVPERPGRPNGFMRPGLAFGTYDRSAATTYVNTWWNSRNPSYNDYGNNDCANFMSQGVYWGGEGQTGTWTPYTSAWVNADSHHSFFALGGRGSDMSRSQLTYGDLIYYNWPASSGEGLYQQWDHVVMVTAFDQYGTPFVSGHSPALGMMNWATWPALYLQGYTNAFTGLLTTYVW